MYSSWCWCCSVRRYCLDSRKHTSDQQRTTGKGPATRSHPRQWATRTAYFFPPCHHTAWSNNPTLSSPLHEMLVCCVHVTSDLKRERDGVAHAPAPRTLRPAQQISAPKTRGLLHSQATLTCCLVPFGWVPLWAVICDLSMLMRPTIN